MATSEHRPGPIARRLLRAPARLYDWNAGWLLGRRFLRLTHIGRRSGRPYRTMLEVIGTGSAPGEVIVIAGLGRSADWYRNVQAQPAAEVAIVRHRFRPAHRVLELSEAAQVLADYERHNRWATPVVRRVLSWLVGWGYDGSEDARWRLARELPIVAFRPREPLAEQRNRRPRRYSSSDCLRARAAALHLQRQGPCGSRGHAPDR